MTNPRSLTSNPRRKVRPMVWETRVNIRMNIIRILLKVRSKTHPRMTSFGKPCNECFFCGGPPWFKKCLKKKVMNSLFTTHYEEPKV